MMAKGLCKRLVGAPVLIPAILVTSETVNPSCLPMKARAELGAGFALENFLFSKINFVLLICIQIEWSSLSKAREKPIRSLHNVSCSP